MKNIFYLAFIAFFISACQKETSESSQPLAERTLMNVSYGADTAQRMDVYLPAGRNTTATKVLVLIHGGAWASGDKSEFNEYIPVFKERLPGYAIVNVNYRLAQLPATNPFPTQETDIKAAISNLVTKNEEYGFNKNKIAMLGNSAGAHLGMLQAYKIADPKIKAVVNMFGPSDMAALYNSNTNPLERFILQALLGGTPATNPEMYHASSPLNFVGSQSPPTLILHGGDDPLVPVSQSQALKTKLEAANVPVQLVIYPGEGHGWFGANLTDSYNRIATFLTTHNP